VFFFFFFKMIFSIQLIYEKKNALGDVNARKILSEFTQNCDNSLQQTI